jgi:hypothetical protein
LSDIGRSNFTRLNVYIEYEAFILFVPANIAKESPKGPAGTFIINVSISSPGSSRKTSVSPNAMGDVENTNKKINNDITH